MSNPFIAEGQEVRNPFVDYKALEIAADQANVQQGLPPEDPLKIPDIEGAVFGNSPQFKELIQKGLQDPESLSKEETAQFEQALELSPEIRQMARQSQEAAESDIHPDLQPIAESFKRLAKSFTTPSIGIGGNPAIGKALFETGNAMLNLTGKAFGEFFGNVIGYEQATGEKVSETVARGLDEIGLKPLEKDDPRAFYEVPDRDGNIQKIKMSEGFRTSTNFLIGAARFLPEISVMAAENPIGFQAAIAQFPLEEANVILEAASGQSFSFDEETGEMSHQFSSDTEVAEAIESLKQQPFSVLLLALMTKGALSRGVKGKGKISVDKAEVEGFIKESTELKAKKTKVAEAEKKTVKLEPDAKEGELQKVEVKPEVQKPEPSKVEKKQVVEEKVTEPTATEAKKTEPTPEQVIEKPKPVTEGTEEMKTSRDLAHGKRFVKSLEEAIKDPERIEQRPVFEKQLAEANKEVADLQVKFDELTKPKKEIKKEDLEKIEPVEVRGAGFDITKPFGSLQSKFANQLVKAEKKRKVETPNKQPNLFFKKPQKDPGVSVALRSPQSIFDAVPDLTSKDFVEFKGEKIPVRNSKYGNLAQEAQVKIQLHELSSVIEEGARGEALEISLSKATKKDFGKKGENLYDHIVDPNKDSQLAPESLKAVKEVREFLEKDRVETIDRIRGEKRASVEKITNRTWRKENDLVGKKLNDKQKAEFKDAVDKELKNRVPDDWGIENYLPQMHPGNYTVWVEEGGIQKRISSARTPNDALNKATEHYANNPEITPESYFVTGRGFTGSDVVRVSSNKYHGLIKDLAKEADNALSRENITKALTGVVGREVGKKKFAPQEQKRVGYEGFRKDLKGVLAIYNSNYVRSKNLTLLNKEVQPLIETIRSKQPRAADALQATLDHVWGKQQTALSKMVDATLQQDFSPVKDFIGPRFYERALGRIKGATVFAFLKANPRFHVLNSFQLMQTTAPIVKGGFYGPNWRTGVKFFNSKEGKKLLDQFGVRHIAGGKFLEGGRTVTKASTREKFGRLAPETFNQEVAWSIMFDEGKKAGMTDGAANYYALLKGNIYSEFAHIASDSPPILRGPTTSTIFQFKRFPIKNLELGFDLLKNKRYAGFSRWFGTQTLLGGAKFITKPLNIVGGATVGYLSLKAHKAIQDDVTERTGSAEAGKRIADAFHYGLPGLVGVDMSGSFNLIDAPYGKTIPEKLGNMFLGPAGQTTVAVMNAYSDTKGLETSAEFRALKEAANRIPMLKSLVALDAIAEKINTGEYNFKTADGQIKFKGELSDAFFKAVGAMTTTESRQNTLIQATAAIAEEYDRQLDIQAAQIIDAIENDKEFDFSTLDEWNILWEEFPMDEKALTARLKARYKSKDLDKWERFIANQRTIFKQMEKFR